MKFFLDTANLDELKKGASWGIVDGVTTNPSLIAKEGRPIEEQVRMICDIVDGDISAEVVSTESGAMITEGRKLAKIHKNIVVKCPLTRDGIKATSALSKEGIRVNVTLCFSAGQALLAAKAGAYIISPFVGRLDDIGARGHGPHPQHHADLQELRLQDAGAGGLASRSPTHVIDSRPRRRPHRHHAVQGAGYALQPPADRQGARPVLEGLCQGLRGDAGRPIMRLAIDARIDQSHSR